MSGLLSGLRVLDLSWGIAGPMAAMTLADHGADVIKIEPPEGDPFREIGRSKLGYKTWQRGKRNAVFDLKDADDLEAFKALVVQADILVESFAAGVTERLGIDYAALSALNPGLIYATIDGYADTSHADRPGYDLLVTARMGVQWEHRGWPEGSIYHTAKIDDPFPDLDIPYEWRQGPPREGPMVIGVPTASVGAMYAAVTSISAALFAREKTGRGQHVRTSLMQGIAAAAHSAWQRAENVFEDGFATWVKSSRAPKGQFLCSDDRWIHNWVANPRFLLSASAGDALDATPDLSVHNDPARFGTEPEEVFVIAHYQPLMAEAVRKFPAKEWVTAGAIADLPIQEVRSPEEALADPAFLADGCVREIVDPELGPIRQLGTLIDFEKTPCTPGGPAATPGQHTAEVKAEAARAAKARPPFAEPPGKPLRSPLEGIRVLDLGLAIAGPYGCQLLGDLGADVIKINAFHDSYWHRNHIAFTSNRSKRSFCVNLKDPKGREVLMDLVRSADVVQHNMRLDAVARLGLDYESLKKIKPDLIYCHVRGYDRGPRVTLPANEQTAACVTGVQYEDGAMARGGKPMWALTMFGDTGTGFLTAIGIIQALWHRDRTGEGQFISTAIVNAQLLSCSYAIARPDGSGFDRPHVDAMQYGFTALYGLYETSHRWLAIAATNAREWAALKAALPAGALDDPDFATAASRRTNDGKLRETLAAIFRSDSAEAWFAKLDAAGAPCEISDETVSQWAQDDPELNRIGLIAHFDHPLVGRFDQVGLYAQLSDTPGVIERGPLVLGDGTAEILAGLGYSAERIAGLEAEKVIGTWKPGEPLLSGPRHYIGGGTAKPAEPEVAEA